MRFIFLKKEQNNYSKCSVFTSFALLGLFFTSNSVVFVDRGSKIIPYSRVQSTIATPLNLATPMTQLISLEGPAI